MKRRVLHLAILVLVLLLVGLGLRRPPRFLIARGAPSVAQHSNPAEPAATPSLGLTRADATALIERKLAEATQAQGEGNLEKSVRLVREAEAIAREYGFPVIQCAFPFPAPCEYEVKFEKALQRFCSRDYSTAHILFSELELARPTDPEPGRYIACIHYNLGIEELKRKKPGESMFFFQQLLARTPEDTEVGELIAFAKKYQADSDLGPKYARRVNLLVERTHGCSQRTK